MRGIKLALIGAVLMPFLYDADIDRTNAAKLESSETGVFHAMEVNGFERSYSVYEPVSRQGDIDKYPLIIALHEGGGSGKALVRMTQGHFNRIADRDGAYVVYPEAIRRYWNEGRNLPLSYAHRNDVDDVEFIRSLIEQLSEKYPIDKARVFVTGMANGGMMAYKLACALPDLITAIAPVNASMPKDIANECAGARGPGLLVMNGTEDPRMPYEGGMITVLDTEQGEVFSTQETINFWLHNNGCPMHSKKNMIPDRDRHDDTTVTVYAYSGCETGARVMLYRVEGGGHTWPGGRQSLKGDEVGRTSKDINACEEIWDFFKMF